MKMILTITTLTILVVYGIYGFATVERRSDQEQIHSLFTNAVDAVQKRDFNGAISCLSKEYKDSSGRNYDQIRLTAANIIRNHDINYTVNAKSEKIMVTGDTATIRARVKAWGSKNEFEYEHEQTLHLTRENGRHAWFLPAKVWKVTGIDNLGIDFGNDW